MLDKLHPSVIIPTICMLSATITTDSPGHGGQLFCHGHAIEVSIVLPCPGGWAAGIIRAISGVETAHVHTAQGAL